MGYFYKQRCVNRNYFSLPKFAIPSNGIHKISKNPGLTSKIFGVKCRCVAITVHTTHNSGVTFSLRSCAAIYARCVWTDTYVYIEVFMLQILGYGRMQHIPPSDHAPRICTTCLLCTFKHTVNMEFCRLWFVVQILDLFSWYVHDLFSSVIRVSW
jgi:hypothetical protein